MTLKHMIDRSQLHEVYDSIAEEAGDIDLSLYVTPVTLTFDAWPLRLDPQSTMGDKTGWLKTKVLLPLAGNPGDLCL